VVVPVVPWSIARIYFAAALALVFVLVLTLVFSSDIMLPRNLLFDSFPA
jgi:hypothetical protein